MLAKGCPGMKTPNPFRELNRRLAAENPVFLHEIVAKPAGTSAAPDYSRRLHYPRIGIYRGKGASHSWLWFVEIFDRAGLYDLCFLTEAQIRTDGLDDMDILVMSGGDTFAVAEALNRRGAENIRSFIERGGLYVGSCAGAYLPLNSSKEHLNLFNFVPAKITNVTSILPEARRFKQKFCTSYGCSFIFHPVRESIRIKTNGFPPFRGAGDLEAPLYGGPPMTVGESSQILATYAAFTEKTLFLVDESLAEETLLGKAAVIRHGMGHGHLQLYGPHFEHPHYPVANDLLIRALYWDMPHSRPPARHRSPEPWEIKDLEAKQFVTDIKRQISNGRIVATGLEILPLSWQIGNKIYEAAKIRVFLETIWQRIRILEKLDKIIVSEKEKLVLLETLSEIVLLLRTIKKGLKHTQATPHSGQDMFAKLNDACALFLKIYFESMASAFKKKATLGKTTTVL